jgi:NADH:ubiquinone oxidoreductase subunit C
MSSNTKLYFKYILLNLKYTFINNFTNKTKNVNIFLPKDTLFYLCLHLKLASPFYLSQLSDIFAYEILIPSFKNENKLFDFNRSKETSSVNVYNFHNLQYYDRFFIFTVNTLTTTKSTKNYANANCFSITELFPAANWLEREVSELHGINFLGKSDLRNLLLQYGDSTAPFQKSFPTIGLQEMYYDPVKDTLIQNPVSVQI